MVSQDYEDLFKTLNAYKIKYLVVGAHAVAFYAQPRFTKDLDIWIPPKLNKSLSVFAALKSFGAPLKGMAPENFQDPKMIFQIGVAPVRIDILIHLPGLSPQKAWKNRQHSLYGKTPINILGPDDLVEVKKRSNRPQDKLDILKLNANIKKKKHNLT